MSRPAHPDGLTRKAITLPDPMWVRVANFRFEKRITTEAEALRRLVQSGLDAEDMEVRKPCK